MKCRHCGSELKLSLVDLGSAPPSNAYLTKQTLHTPEKWVPLRVLVCEYCWLAQTEDFSEAHELFSADYAYFSTYSSSWLAHAAAYVERMIARFGLTPDSLVAEVAANDGYLLQYVRAAGIPCYGIEPTTSTAVAARARGIEIVERFFNLALADELATTDKQADLVVANNVLAHVPDINNFTAGFVRLLKPGGTATFEFPHLLQLINENQFDTIYHEHFSYLSLTAVDHIFAANGLAIFDVEELTTHGGSLRIYAQPAHTAQYPRDQRVNELLTKEARQGIREAAYYAGFQAKINRVKDDLLLFLLKAKRQGKRVAAYGAAAKGNTLINYTGIRPDLISFVVDRNPAKQGKYMPGSHIPIVEEAMLRQEKPDYIVILPWNLHEEITAQLAYAKKWGGKFVTAIPELTVSQESPT